MEGIIMMSDHSQLLERAMGIIYPIILIFGVYVILNGHISPGGGFQGGAILGSVFIAKYLGDPIQILDLKTVQTIEKTALLVILLSATFYVTMNLYAIFTGTLYIFFILSNILIGIKVACGMTVIFYRFVFYESR
ncbi:MAG TPA: sodium:proton antiporter [Clostridiales bacterium UBA8960]|nr:sodium:proton antiporter [Clostridiales bacterium UBA8960]